MKIVIQILILLFIFSCKKETKNCPESPSELVNNADTTSRLGIYKYHMKNDNYKDSIVEFLRVNKKEYVNQIWLVNDKNDTVGGNYFDMYANDTTRLGEIARIRFELTAPAISQESDIFILIPNDVTKLETDFTNLFELKLDTIHSLKNDGFDHPALQNSNLRLNHIVEFGIDYDIPEKKEIRGVLVEKGIYSDKLFERRLYFDESIQIVD